MEVLVPLALTLGGAGLVAFLWSLRSGQHDYLYGAAWRPIADDEPPQEAEGQPLALQVNREQRCGREG